MPLISRCICGGADFKDTDLNDLPMRECTGCGVLHQRLDMTADDVADWYAKKYHAGIYTHGFDQDFEVGQKRVRAYGWRLKGPVLDIGCGNGGFVAAVRKAGHYAIGQDLGGEGADVIAPIEALRGIYATITMHDVLEHAPDPLAMLQVVRNLLDDAGWLIIDFPSFFEEAGRHHWKAVEHIWMLSGPQLRTLLTDAGFKVVESRHPVPGKVTVFAQCAN